MSAQDRIWAAVDDDVPEIGRWASYAFADAAEYLRRAPAVLAADPMVGALLAAVIEEAAATLDARASQLWDEMAGFWAGSVAFKRMEQRRLECLIRRDEVRALTPADATASLARMLRDAMIERLTGIEQIWRSEPVLDYARKRLQKEIRNLKEPTDDQA